MSLLLIWLTAGIQALHPAPSATGQPVREMMYVPPVPDDVDWHAPAAATCIASHRIRSTRIIRGAGIIYEMAGRKRYINRLRFGASQLDQRDIILIRSPSGLLCAGDTLQLIDGVTGSRSIFVGLGSFERVGENLQAAP
ncbi:hypothetical protein C7451_10234 [Blastomonas natatoria]|uniref:Uncharacterized protein n=1 Tax=Blastomonas natatoria TaxID=34015 RepID=A0A2V3VB26_9SPHN|nr:hypothetical protein [Blastomonas natatoria]PXW78364.1 hypothetical protein C7451_10234 [Blastomonas natatoria]